jgi:hypothetical protein
MEVAENCLLGLIAQHLVRKKKIMAKFLLMTCNCLLFFIYVFLSAVFPDQK